MKGGILTNLGTKILHWANTNSPSILTGLNCAGVVLTAMAAIQAYKKSNDILKDNDLQDAPIIDKAAEVWPYWVPPVLIGGATMAAGIGANSIHESRQVAMIASYDILKSQAAAFRDHAIEEIGRNKVRKIEHDIHADELRRAVAPEEELQVAADVDTGGVLVFDKYSGQYIKTTYEKVRAAAERVNAELRPYGKGGQDWVSHADFLVWIGGDYSEACEKWGYIAMPFGDPLDPNDILDVHSQEYKNHICTVAYLNVFCEDKNFL